MGWPRGLAVVTASLLLFAPQGYGQQRVHRVGVLVQSEMPEQTEFGRGAA